MDMKFHHTKQIPVLFSSGKSRKDVRENMPLSMDKLYNCFFSLQSAYIKNSQYHPASLSHYVLVRTRIDCLPRDKEG